MNSAGMTGATPIRQMRGPLSMSSWLIVLRSQRTKKVSSSVRPISAPLRHTLIRKSVTLRRTFAQVGSWFGSKTTHCVPSSIDSSMKMKRRRTLTYFHSGSLDIVRAPQTRMARPSGRKSRMAFTPRGFKISWSPRETGRWRFRALRCTSLAGALCTPRSMSVRA